jgi:hypothetical protein
MKDRKHLLLVWLVTSFSSICSASTKWIMSLSEAVPSSTLSLPVFASSLLPITLRGSVQSTSMPPTTLSVTISLSSTSSSSMKASLSAARRAITPVAIVAILSAFAALEWQYTGKKYVNACLRDALLLVSGSKNAMTRPLSRSGSVISCESMSFDKADAPVD